MAKCNNTITVQFSDEVKEKLAEAMKVVEANTALQEEIQRLREAIGEYEDFIGWIDVQSKIGFENKSMIPKYQSLTLKQIHSRIIYPTNTQLEKARKLAGRKGS
jgi:hypothetical protein